MTGPRTSNRRELAASIAGGAILGAIWGATFPAVARETRPSIAIVGHRGAQFVLIDSTKARALLLVGQPDDVLIERLPAMMTLFRQRIDLIIGTHASLAARAASLQKRWSIQRGISLESRSEPANLAIPTTSVDEGVAISLGAGLELICTVGYRGDWRGGRGEGATVFWTAQLRHEAGYVTFAPDAASLQAAGPAHSGLLVIPQSPEWQLLQQHSVTALAVNHDANGAESRADVGVSLARLFPQDIARFAFEDERIILPPWTETSSDS